MGWHVSQRRDEIIRLTSQKAKKHFQLRLARGLSLIPAIFTSNQQLFFTSNQLNVASQKHWMYSVKTRTHQRLVVRQEVWFLSSHCQTSWNPAGQVLRKTTGTHFPPVSERHYLCAFFIIYHGCVFLALHVHFVRLLLVSQGCSFVSQ